MKAILKMKSVILHNEGYSEDEKCYFSWLKLFWRWKVLFFMIKAILNMTLLFYIMKAILNIKL